MTADVQDSLTFIPQVLVKYQNDTKRAWDYKYQAGGQMAYHEAGGRMNTGVEFNSMTTAPLLAETV